MKIKTSKIIKGLVFLALAVLFMITPFFNKVDTIDVMIGNYNYQDVSITILKSYPELSLNFRKETWHNYAIGSLFIILGILELKEGVFNGD